MRYAKPVALALTIAFLANPPPAALAISPSAEQSKQAAGFVAGLMGQVEAVALIGAAWFAEKLCDPKQCSIALGYREVTVPAIPANAKISDASLALLFSKPVPASVLAQVRSAADQQAVITATEVAVLDTIDKRYTAKMRRDPKSLHLQNGQLRKLIAQAATQKQAANVRWQAVLRSLATSNVRTRPLPSPQTYAAGLAKNGLPLRETQLLRAWHVSDAHIQQIRVWLIAKGKNDTTRYRFEDLVHQLITANEHNEDMAHCSCVEPK